MSKVLIFGGTTEGRLISQVLSNNNISCDLCVATEYGEQVLEDSENINVYVGRMSINEMRDFYIRNNTKIIIDVTHPYATLVSENIKKSIINNIKLIRFERDTNIDEKNDCCTFFDSIEDCINALKNKTGNILLTTGSKDLNKFCKNEEIKNRIIARVIPGIESLKLCYDAGLDGKQIIAIQGPFSESMNLLQIKEYGINTLVTKQSGSVGGWNEKINACKKSGINCYVIKNNENIIALKNENTVSCYNDLYERLEKILECKINHFPKLLINLCGIGMGNPNFLTLQVKNEIQNSKYIFGAKRVLCVLDTPSKKYPYYTAKEIVPVLKDIQKNEIGTVKISILFSGDCGFYSGSKKLLQEIEKMENVSIKMLPGISSISYLASKFCINYEDAKIISLHGKEEKDWSPKLLEYLNCSEKIFFITSGLEDVKKIGNIIHSFEQKNSYCKFKILLGYELSYSNEKLFNLNSLEVNNLKEEGLYSGFLIKDKEF